MERHDDSLATAPSNEHRAPSNSVPRERMELLCDPGSFMAIRSGIRSETAAPTATAWSPAPAPSGGRPVYCYAQDPTLKGGSLGASHADSIVRVMRLAGEAGAPVVGFVESGGARLQDGHAALAGYGRIFRASVELSRRVPQVSIVAGVSAGGGAYSPALTDFVVMTEDARMFLTGPKIVREALGEDVGMDELGGPGVHAANGVCQLVAADVRRRAELTRELLAFLPRRIGDGPGARLPEAADGGDPGAAGPRRARGASTTCATSIAAIADGGRLVELDARWARNMVTGFARIEGRAGRRHRQPAALARRSDRRRGLPRRRALFVDRCSRFGIPLVVLVDTPGFMPGTRQEGAGVIRYGAQLLRAFAAARVPKLTVILRKAYGGAVITMNSRDLGADMVFAWPERRDRDHGRAPGRRHHRAPHDRGRAGRAEASATRSRTTYAGEHLTAAAAAASRLRRRGDRAGGDAARVSTGRWRSSEAAR